MEYLNLATLSSLNIDKYETADQLLLDLNSSMLDGFSTYDSSTNLVRLYVKYSSGFLVFVRKIPKDSNGYDISWTWKELVNSKYFLVDLQPTSIQNSFISAMGLNFSDYFLRKLFVNRVGGMKEKIGVHDLKMYGYVCERLAETNNTFRRWDGVNV